MTVQRHATNNVVTAFTVYNPPRELEDHVRVAALESAHVLVIDDGSAQALDNLEKLVRCAENVTVISKPKNLGIADSVNSALDFAIQLRVGFLMFFDQDTVIHTGLIQTAVNSAMRYQATTTRPFGCLGAGVVHGRRYSGGGPHQVYEVAELIQSGTVFSVNALESIGGANSAMVIDAVDTDICLRLREQGWSVAVDSSISITHPVGSGNSFSLLGYSVMVTNHTPSRRYYMTRNRVFILKQLRWWRFDPRWCLIFCRRFVVSCVVAAAFEPQKLAKIRAIGIGLNDGFRGRLGIRRLG